jgi:RHS repeat-associated protein
VQDHLGTTRVIINENGTTAGQYDYDAWGEVIWQSDTPPRKGFIDKEKDKESGDHNFGVRQYKDGRFTSIDPLWEKYRSWSPYCYSANNPLLFKDADGKQIGRSDNTKIDGGSMFPVPSMQPGPSAGQILGGIISAITGWFVASEMTNDNEKEQQAPPPPTTTPAEGESQAAPDVKEEAQKLANEIGKNSVLLPDKTRVDLVGQPGSDKTHYNKKTGEKVPIPHTHDPVKNVNPKGQEFVKTSRDARPTTPEDIARVKEFIKKNLSED